MTPPVRLAHRVLLRALPAAAALLAFAACESDHPGRGDRGSDSAAQEPGKEAPEMEAKGLFFSGQVEAQVVLNRAGFAGRGSGRSGDSSANDSGGGGRAGGGAGLPGGHRHGGGSGGSPEAAAGAGADGDAAPQIRPSNLPAVGLHLRLTNHGSEATEAEVADFNSDLGDFVVEPEKLELPPNVPVDALPMISQLGVTSDAIPLTVSLRVTDPAGKHRFEKQVLVLKVMPPAAAPGPAPAPVR